MVPFDKLYKKVSLQMKQAETLDDVCKAADLFLQTRPVYSGGRVALENAISSNTTLSVSSFDVVVAGMIVKKYAELTQGGGGNYVQGALDFLNNYALRDRRFNEGLGMVLGIIDKEQGEGIANSLFEHYREATKIYDA